MPLLTYLCELLTLFISMLKKVLFGLYIKLLHLFKSLCTV